MRKSNHVCVGIRHLRDQQKQDPGQHAHEQSLQIPVCEPFFELTSCGRAMSISRATPAESLNPEPGLLHRRIRRRAYEPTCGPTVKRLPVSRVRIPLRPTPLNIGGPGTTREPASRAVSALPSARATWQAPFEVALFVMRLLLVPRRVSEGSRNNRYANSLRVAHKREPNDVRSLADASGYLRKPCLLAIFPDQFLPEHDQSVPSKQAPGVRH